MAKLLACPAKSGKRIEIVEDGFKTLELGVIVDKVLKRGTKLIAFCRFVKAHADQSLYGSLRQECNKHHSYETTTPASILRICAVDLHIPRTDELKAACYTHGNACHTDQPFVRLPAPAEMTAISGGSGSDYSY